MQIEIQLPEGLRDTLQRTADGLQQVADLLWWDAVLSIVQALAIIAFMVTVPLLFKRLVDILEEDVKHDNRVLGKISKRLADKHGSHTDTDPDPTSGHREGSDQDENPD